MEVEAVGGQLGPQRLHAQDLNTAEISGNEMFHLESISHSSETSKRLPI